MAGLRRDAELEQLLLDVDHVRQHAVGDGTEVVILELLTARRLGAEQRALRVQQVGTRHVELAIDQEVLLLGARVRHHATGRLVAEQLQDALGLVVQRLHRAEQRRLLVERLTGPRHERGRDAERVAVRDVRRAGHVPRRVAARGGRRTNATIREARRVRLTLDQRLARELHQRAAFTVGAQEAVVLLRREAGERVEDVSVVRGAFRHGPFLHRGRDRVRDHRIESLTALDRALQRPEDLLGQVGLHRGQAEDVAAEELVDGSGLFVGSRRDERRSRDLGHGLLALGSSGHDRRFPFALVRPRGIAPLRAYTGT